MMKVLGIGESVIDKVYLDGVFKDTYVGGSVLSALILMSRLGLVCDFLTSVGQDDEGKLILQKLKIENINAVEKLQAKSKINKIFINTKTGQRKKLRGNTKHLPIENLSPEFIKAFDFIILDRHEKLAFYEVFKHKKASAQIIIDTSTEVSSFTLDMIKYAQYPILPIEFLLKFARGKDLNTSLKLLHKVCNKPFIITAGERGSIVYDGKKSNLIPAFKVRVLDVTGAGDVYRGAFAYGLIKKFDINEAAKFANSVAALQCRKLGNAEAIPSREEIEEVENSKF